MKVTDSMPGMVEAILAKIIEGYSPQKVILFGSYAYGEPDEDSDLDLFIIKETTERAFDRRVRVCQLVSDPRRRVPVEVIVLTPEEVEQRLRIGDQFIEEILSQGRVLYAAS